MEISSDVPLSTSSSHATPSKKLNEEIKDSFYKIRIPIKFSQEDHETLTTAPLIQNSCNINIQPQRNGLNKKSGIAITVNEARKSYGKDLILKNFQMTVQEGSIYGLLGSSGCGKTTLLSCIVGLRQLDQGEVFIHGKSPGTPGSGVPGRLIGYMPQDIALNEEFTLNEVCHFFGQLYGMKSDSINQRVKYLVNLLDLSKCKGHLSNFSGGQKRRASFLISLLHDSQILILDEPTVGVDPVLRTKIWSHIRKLVDSDGKTVIITTHYIEEMRQADTVGIMRDGELMAEDSPQSLIEQHNATMLEEVVLKYCLQVEEDTSAKSLEPRLSDGFKNIYKPRLSDAFIKNPIRKFSSSLATDFNHENTSQLNRVWALTLKNIVVLMRNVGFVLFLFVVPALITGFFAIAIGHDPTDIGLGFINDEVVGDCVELNITSSCNSTQRNIGCDYINILSSMGAFNMEKYNSKETALKAVEERRIWGYVYIPKQFSLYTISTIFGKPWYTNDIPHLGNLYVELDMSSISIGLRIKMLLLEAYKLLHSQLLIHCGINTTAQEMPIFFGDPIYGSEENKFSTYVVPGIVIGFLPFMSCVSCALSYIIEKKDGMIDRTKVAGTTAFDIILSHAIPQFGIVLVQTFITFAIMYLYNIPFDIGSPILAFFLTILAAVTGMTMGFTAAQIFDEEKNAMLFAMAAIFPSFLLSGLLWPIEGLPAVFKFVSYALPGTLAAESMRSILFRGWGLEYFTVYIGFIAQFIFIVIFSVLTFIFHYIKK